MANAVVARPWMHCQGHIAHGISRLEGGVPFLVMCMYGTAYTCMIVHDKTNHIVLGLNLKYEPKKSPVVIITPRACTGVKQSVCLSVVIVIVIVITETARSQHL